MHLNATFRLLAAPEKPVPEIRYSPDGRNAARCDCDAGAPGVAPSRFPVVLALALLACGFCLGEMRGAEQSADCGPLFCEAAKEFESMKSTLYQHKTEVNRAAGTYRYDCVGFVSYALRQAAPEAWASAVKVTGIAKGRIPSPPRYRAFFAGLTITPQPGWKAVTKVSELRRGDVVAWEHRTQSAVGHALIIGSDPVPGPDGNWTVVVYDSTSSPHSEDSRLHDERAQVLPSTGRRSGLGHGVMVLVADPASKALTGFRWSLKARTNTVPIAAGRPVS
jgi:hypothetical protein